jgi:hypothetical protein
MLKQRLHFCRKMHLHRRPVPLTHEKARTSGGPQIARSSRGASRAKTRGMAYDEHWSLIPNPIGMPK